MDAAGGYSGQQEAGCLVEVNDDLREEQYCEVPSYPLPVQTRVAVEVVVEGHPTHQKLTLMLRYQRNHDQEPPEYYAFIVEDPGDFVVTIDVSSGTATIVKLRDVSHLGPSKNRYKRYAAERVD